MKTIRYGIDDDNLIYATYDDYYSVVEFSFGEIDIFNIRAESIYKLNPYIVHFTTLLPINVKNAHRKFWGMKPLTVEKVVPRWFLDYGTEDTLNDIDITAPKPAFDIVQNLHNNCKKYYSSFSRRPRILRLFGDIDLDQVIVFDLASADIPILREKLSFYDATKHLEIKPCSWKTYGW